MIFIFYQDFISKTSKILFSYVFDNFEALISFKYVILLNLDDYVTNAG